MWVLSLMWRLWKPTGKFVSQKFMYGSCLLGYVLSIKTLIRTKVVTKLMDMVAKFSFPKHHVFGRCITNHYFWNTPKAKKWWLPTMYSSKQHWIPCSSMIFCKTGFCVAQCDLLQRWIEEIKENWVPCNPKQLHLGWGSCWETALWDLELHAALCRWR